MSQLDALSAPNSLADAVNARFGDTVAVLKVGEGDHTLVVGADDWLDVATVLRDEEPFRFDALIDVCGVDYLGYGRDEWKGNAATRSGFSRGVHRQSLTHRDAEGPRFAAVIHLLSYVNNHRLRVRVYAPDDEAPRVPSSYPVWNAADWFEREAFDLYGILFDGHPDLRRLLTDYGFVGHPFRKDFPISGHAEVRYDPEQGRVVYQPVTIAPRTLVPRVIRQDNRYDANLTDDPSGESEHA
ncbi:MAG: NADH-quinone oxidoreductase subunit C [Pseudomonadota bacterium]